MIFSGINQWVTTQLRFTSLKHIFRGISLLVIVLLSLVSIMAVRQYLLFHQCREALSASDQILFQYTTIKEHITRSLITDATVDTTSLGSDLQSLSTKVEGLNENIIIPEQLKKLLVARVDLIGLMVDLRTVQSQHAGAVELARTLETINSKLQQFRLSLADHTRMLLLGLQKMIIGLLALVLVIVTAVLFTMNHTFAAPILALSQRLKHHATTPNPDAGTLAEMVEVVDSLLNGQQVPAKQGAAPLDENNIQEAFAKESLLYRYAATGSLALETSSSIINTINGVINYTQALADTETNEGSIQERKHLLGATLREEKKIATQSSEFQRIARKLTKETGHSPLHQLLTQLKAGLEKSFKQDNIALLLPSGDLPPTQIPDGELWFLLSCCCWDGKAILQSHKGAADQWIQIQPLSAPDQHISLTFSNSTATWPEPFSTASPCPWMSATFFRQLLNHYDGECSMVPQEDEGTALQLNLPLQRSSG